MSSKAPTSQQHEGLCFTLRPRDSCVEGRCVWAHIRSARGESRVRLSVMGCEPALPPVAPACKGGGTAPPYMCVLELCPTVC